MPTLAELQAKLDSVRREVRNLTVMGMDPSQPPDQAALIKELERSARVEMRLRTMALEHAKGQLRSHRQQRGTAIDPARQSFDKMTLHPYEISSGRRSLPPPGLKVKRRNPPKFFFDPAAWSHFGSQSRRA
jgi:hypothetical protein